jgi:hypothetical protein
MVLTLFTARRVEQPHADAVFEPRDRPADAG